MSPGSSPSPFLSRQNHTVPNSLAILHLKRDLQVPIVLREEDENNEGYDEGKVTNTRFGSFPHSTLIGVPWGSQVRASAVDTGSRGRRPKNVEAIAGQKRKREQNSDPSTPASDTTAAKTASKASTGFVHVLPPTPESWTLSLPHRTQVVYTPDYSYVLQKLRVRPGSVVIEAGAGSGSFTHAAARAVYGARLGDRTGARGRVWSFEFHAQRAEKLRAEVQAHGLDEIVTVTHRDVYEDGFTIWDRSQQIVQADAVFLDLPAPWIALRHLKRSISTWDPHELSETQMDPPHNLDGPPEEQQYPPRPSTTTPLSPQRAVHICAFLPCIEQVQRCMAELRSSGWVEVSMVELAARRIEVRRERTGLQEEGLRGVNASAASVEEAVAKLRDIEARTAAFHADEEDEGADATVGDGGSGAERMKRVSKQERLREIRERAMERKLYQEGRLVTRAEPEVKSHTSYLVFAVLPREWSQQDEEAARAKWDGECVVEDVGNGKAKGKGRRAEKRERRMEMEKGEKETTQWMAGIVNGTGDTTKRLARSAGDEQKRVARDENEVEMEDVQAV